MKKLNSEEKPIPDSGLLEPFIKLIPANCDDTFKSIVNASGEENIVNVFNKLISISRWRGGRTLDAAPDLNLLCWVLTECCNKHDRRWQRQIDAVLAVRSATNIPRD